MTDPAPPFSEEALALEFAELHGDEARYVAAWNKWLFYDGRRWQVDAKKKVFTLARKLIRSAAMAVNKAAEAKRLASAKTCAAVVSLAQADPKLAAGVEQWDADPWLLNTPNGVVDLSTGVIKEHRADDYMTKITAVAPDASCPTPIWRAFLDTVTNQDEDFRSYLMRTSGYSLTGITREQELFFLYGDGANGKGTYLMTISKIMGDYHCEAPIETFTELTFDRHPTELAMLQGARLVTSTETEDGRQWAESRIKKLTGDDSKVAARFMRQDFFHYQPQFKITIMGNHKPSLRSVDEAIRRRFNMLPFMVKIPENKRDKELAAKLKAEWPGILAQMIAGCLEWQRIGLEPPKVVRDATETYLQEEDVIARWFNEGLVEVKDGWLAFDVLFFDWKRWAERNGEKINSSKWFSARLKAMKLRPRRNGHGDAGFCGMAWAP